MRWRLGIDLGAKSLGWAAFRLDDAGQPVEIIAAGSRIFSDGRGPSSESQSGTPLAVERRAARSTRRRRDRFKQRQAALLKHLTLAGMLPGDETARKALTALDPFELRARALHEPLPLTHLGRAMFHLNQRRGFKSNRKTDRGQDDVSGKIRVGAERLRREMAEHGAATLGEYLHGRRSRAIDDNHIPSVRARLRPETGEGAKGDGYDFYPDRALLEEEFDLIWESQASHHPEILTDELGQRLFEVIFNQRPLKAPKIGKCTLIPTEERLPKAHPLFQQRRLLEELNALRIETVDGRSDLTLEQRDLLFLKLKGQRSMRFERLRTLLKLDPEARFNKEANNRTELKGDEVAAEMGSKTRFGARWAHMSVEQQWTILSRLIEEEDETILRGWLEGTYSLTPEQAKSVAGARLPAGYGRFGETATHKLIDALRADVIVYSVAVERAGLGHHSDHRTGESFDRLPYYGEVLERDIMPGTAEPSDPEEMRIGRLTNPTVHIGLNQLRRVVNELIATYGKPAEIAIELARELKLDDERKREINNRNKTNRAAAEIRSRKLIELRQSDNGGNRAILKLWEELDRENVMNRRCVYTGQQISAAMLFSGDVEVDHILPFSETLDDSADNRLLCIREANRAKRKRSPVKAFSTDPSWDWEAIKARSALLPREKRWRFEPDAMHRFDKDGGFIARHLVDTQYLSRLARQYLSALYADRGEGSGHVWVSPGRLTEMLRRSWGLNSLLPDHNFGGGANQPKNRLDHRHHAIDAAVIGVTNRSLLNRIATEAGRRGLEGSERIAADLEAPWDGFRDDLKAAVSNIVVSHRPDHGSVAKTGMSTGRDSTAGRLHNDTAYGLTGEKDDRGNDLVVHRVPLTSLKNADHINRVRDCDLRTALLAATAGKSDKEFAAVINAFSRLGPLLYRGIRRVRLIEPLDIIPIRDRSGQIYKGYKGDSNYRFDVWELSDGKWIPDVVSMFDVHQPGHLSQVRANHPTARKVLSLHQNDIVAIEADDGVRKLMRVVKFGQSGQLTLAAPNEGGDLKKRDAASNEHDPFKYIAPTASGLKKIKTRQVRIDALGRVQDPGFPAQTARRKTRGAAAP
jgi:CRISPR-associated endonuclease Csn1